MKPTVRAIAALAALLATGCGTDSAGSDAPASAVATTTQVGDLVRQVGGDRVDVAQVLDANADPHDYEPRPSDVREIEAADVVFRSGGDVDDWLGELAESAGGDAQQVSLIESVRTRGDDPHWWQDPLNADRAVVAIRDALIQADPDGASAYRTNAASYRRRLRALDRGVAACIARVPRAQRKLVTTHDALGYYADRYGLAVVGALIPSLSSQAQASARDIGALVEQIEDEGVRAVFPESSLDTRLERAVARESAVRVGGALWADTLGPEGSDGDTYIESVASNTETLTKGLTGGQVACRPRA